MSKIKIDDIRSLLSD
jgi:Holliday junction resolvasome RuvABC endonuclease subunit